MSLFVYIRQIVNPVGLGFYQHDPVTDWDVWVYDFDDDSAKPFLTDSLAQTGSAFSPDGKWIAYHSNEGGPYEVYVVPYPDGAPKCKLSTAGGEEPHWSADGDELFYRQGTKAMVADVTARDFCGAQSHELFDGLEQWAWDVSPAGDFFVTVEVREPPQLHVALSWLQELKRLAPTGGSR